MHKLDNAELLALWLDKALSEQQRQEFERLCIEDAEFAAQVEAANFMAVQADCYQPESVPDWNRANTFEISEKRHWWQWQGLPAMSFACSALAIVMVISGVEFQVKDGTMTISFADQPSPQEINVLVDNKLKEFKQSQQVALNTYAQALQKQQIDNNAQLTSYLLTSSRKERREDFAELIKFVNEQRSDDQLFYARQLNKLQQDVYTESGHETWQPTNVPSNIQE